MMTNVTLELGQTVAEAALAKAREIGSPSSIAVLDAGRELVAFARMDGAPLASVPISQAKAYTARSLNSATRDLNGLTQPGGPLFGLEVSHLAAGRALVTFGGGVPITVDGEVIGAIGVAGGTPDQDHEIAEAGAAAAKNG
jgi:uncharacterized protein GlcG (DUF336 family)